MGADGGTIPKRCELVRKKKKKEKLDKRYTNATKWKNCQLTQMPLKKPIICDRLGRLYSKEAVIEAILTKEIGKIKQAAHIRGLKDIKELKLTPNPDYKDTGAESGDTFVDTNQTEFMCPVTALPMNGENRFIVNWKCGCVISEKAIREVKSNVCHGCSGPYNPEDSIELYPDDELLEEYKKKLPKRKEKKEKEREGSSGEEKKEQRAPKRKAETESTIQKDPSKSEAFKNLFTTCEAAKKQPQGHWVTHNPLFY